MKAWCCGDTCGWCFWKTQCDVDPTSIAAINIHSVSAVASVRHHRVLSKTI